MSTQQPESEKEQAIKKLAFFRWIMSLTIRAVICAIGAFACYVLWKVVDVDAYIPFLFFATTYVYYVWQIVHITIRERQQTLGSKQSERRALNKYASRIKAKESS